MSRGRLVALGGVFGAAVLGGWLASSHFTAPPNETASTPIENGQATVAAAISAPAEPAPAAVIPADPAPVEAASPPASSEPVVEPPQLAAAGDVPPATQATAAEPPPNAPAPAQPDEPRTQIAYANTPDTVSSEAKPDAPPGDVTGTVPEEAKDTAIPVEVVDECVQVASCIDEYLFALYQRAPKIDSIRVSERVKVTVTTKKGKTKTVTKTVSKFVDDDFGWKDPKAAERVSMPLLDYVIGGMDRSFKLKLYRTLRAADAAGLEPGITSGFRDDYRQGIASGKKAASDSSYHGGSRRGGYGHGLAADLVSVRGATRAQRCLSSEVLWKWIDAHGSEYGVGRPYLDRDPPHVGPMDGKEYVDKRGLNRSRLAGQTKDKNKAKLAAAAKVQRVAVQTKKPAAAAGDDKPKATAAVASSEGVAQPTKKPRNPAAGKEQAKVKPVVPANAPRVVAQTKKPQAPAAGADQSKTKPAAQASVQRVAQQTSKPHAPAASAEHTKTKPAAPANVQRVALQTSKPHAAAARADQTKTKRAKPESKPNSI